MSMPHSEESTSSSNENTGIFPDINRNDIVFGKNLGFGSFGTVFSGVWSLPDGQKRTVALKKVFVLEKEAEILSKIRHKNIIQFYGICKSTMSDFFIVTECADRGSLYDHIHSSDDPNSTSYSFDVVLTWAAQIASGIQYLHYDAVDTIIHRDLKSKNVVLNSNLVCKICDFGTSKDLTHSCTAPSWGGTAAWMSPEMILQSQGLTRATDVWSYGVVLWEIMSREVPYKDYTEFRIFTLITQNGVTLAIPASCPAQIKQLMNNCWKMDPKDRINMRQILGELTRMQGNQEIMEECEKFMELEDWRTEIEKQEKNVEKMRKNLEKRREKLEIRERALKQRQRVEEAVMASARHPPEDVHQWSEHHTSHWIDTILARLASNDKKFLDRVNAAVFRHRITGTRLLEMSQNDLEYLGVQKLGSRIELMKAIRKLGENQATFRNFPTLEQASRLDKLVLTKSPTTPDLLPITDVPMLILVGVYIRTIHTDPTRKRLKFFIDTDWNYADDGDDLKVGGAYRKSKPSSTFVKNVCFSVLDEITKKPINEPICTISAGMTSTPEWIDVDDRDDLKIKCITSIYFADTVTQPRNTEIVVYLENLRQNGILFEQNVHLKFRKSVETPTTMMHQTASSPQLRGFWHRKANLGRHGLTETELSSLQEHMRTPSPRPAGLQDEDETTTVTNGRRRAMTLSTDEKKTTPRKSIHGGKDKWTWKKTNSRPKFT